MSNPIRGSCAAVVLAATLVAVPAAGAHATVSPPVTVAKTLQLFSLAVPTEKDGATTTTIQLTVPSGFAIDSFEPAPGWTRSVRATGSGEEQTVQQVTWRGGRVPTDEDSVFRFVATPTSEQTYTFTVRQTYSNGSVVDWSGSESSDTPAPTIEAKSSLGGGGSDTLSVIAIVVGGIGVVLGAVALLAASGRRPLT